MEVDFFMEGTNFDLISLFLIFLAGCFGYLAFKKISLIPRPISRAISPADTSRLTTNINQQSIRYVPYHFLRVFLTHQRSRSSLDSLAP